MDNEQQWNQRFVEYARVNGKRPHEIRAGYGFMSWMARKWATFKAANGYRPEQSMTPGQHEAFDRWLAKEAE